MTARRKGSEDQRTRPKPATTLEARENELITQAVDLAEKQIREGTASSQVVTHYLKLGSTREVLEQERLRHENELTRVKIQAVESQARIEELYKSALDAMRSYSPSTATPDDVDEG